MAAKKFYAVKKGKITGVFNNWTDCRDSIDGFSNAEYKGFATLEEARAYLGDPAAEIVTRYAAEEASPMSATQPQRGDTLQVYVDGSYDDGLKKYAFGCVFLTEDGIRLACGNGDNPESLQHRNVTGEMLGAMYAVRAAMMSGFASVELLYDYEGIEKWVTGEWRSKTLLTGKYAASMREWSRSIQIRFTKVPAHSNVKYNELADKTAKRGLTEANGVPKVVRLEELERYEDTVE